MSIPKWLQTASIYSVYPQSFFDSNGDGIGDIAGLIEKLPYIKDLGFTAMWLNPIFESPFVDAGYDITDFYKVAPRYGKNEDVRKLCDAAHSLGIRILLDLVAGHVSTEHKGFSASARKEKNEWSDRFIWTDGKAPYKDRSDKLFFSMTECKNSDRDGYYHYNYYKEQPSINYGFAGELEPWQLPPSHPACRKNVDELIHIMEYWFGYGVDGFRVDMASSLVKNDTDHVETKKIWQYIRAWFDENYPDHVLLSEWGIPKESLTAGFHMDIMLHHGTPYLTRMFRNEYYARKYKALRLRPGTYSKNDDIEGPSYFRKEGQAVNEFREGIDSYIDQYKATRDIGLMANMTGSHDIRRLSVGRDEDDLKVCYTHIALMPGVFVNYYGDEIGMRNLPCPDVEGARDRSLSRTPMQWNDDKNRGFSVSDTPYLPTDRTPYAPTVEKQKSDENSLFSYVKSLLRLKATCPALTNVAEYRLIQYGYPEVFERSADGQTIRVLIQPKEEKTVYTDPEADTVLLSSRAAFDGASTFTLQGVSAVVYTVKK